MKTRAGKYVEATKEVIMPRKRTSKNVKLYEEIRNSAISDFDIGSNARVIGEQQAQMDIDKIREILEKNYQEPPKRHNIDIPVSEPETLEMEDTLEYDINSILEKAHENKAVDSYEQERLKKVRDTQFDILKNLDLDNDSKSSEKKDTKEELMDLINTISLNEKQVNEIQEETGDLDPLDMFTDLKGDGDTVVAGFKEEIRLAEEENDSVNKKMVETSEIDQAREEVLDESFYSDDLGFSKSDFGSLGDKDTSAVDVIIKILIVLVVIGIVAGIVLFLNEFLNLGWF